MSKDVEEQIDIFAELIPAAIIIQVDGNIVFANQRAASLLAASNTNALLGLWSLDLVDPDEKQKMLGYRSEIVSGNSSTLNIEINHLRMDGSVFPCEINIGPVVWQGQSGTINMLRDISDRKLSEATLARRDKEREIAQKLAKLGYWRLDQHSDHLEWSDELYRIYGLDPKTTNLTRKLAKDMKLPTDENLFSNIQSEIKERDVTQEIEYRIIRADGEMRVLHATALPEIDEHGDIVSLFGVSQDVTEQVNAKNELAASEARFQDLAELGADWFWELDEELRYTYYSDEYNRMSGLSNDRYIGKTREEIGPGGVDADIWAEHLKVLKNHQPFKDFHCEHTFANGQHFHWKISGKPYFDFKGTFKGYRGTGTDTNAQIKLEEKLKQSQKMEAVGHLAGGVAHDFNNILGVVQGNAELLKEKIENNEVLDTQFVNAVLKASDRGAELTQSMLAFSRKQQLRPQSINLDDQVQSMTAILRRTLGETISVETKSEDGLWNCNADPGQVENALLNLAINARDAMPKGGTLTIETTNVLLDDEYASAQADLEPGKYIMLAVSDTGEGIAAENLKHVLEPFYTTKEVGKGTGLGLSMVFGFAKQSGGHLNIYSEVGHGTTIKIYLPRSDKHPELTSLKQLEEVNNGDEIILVVEDDPDMRTLAVALLSDMGYRIREAKDGPAALSSIETDGPVDLLLTDVVLPQGINGAELASRVTNLHPETKTLFMSGYTEDAFSANKLLSKEVELLHKPFRKADLAKKVRTILDNN